MHKTCTGTKTKIVAQKPRSGPYHGISVPLHPYSTVFPISQFSHSMPTVPLSIPNMPTVFLQCPHTMLSMSTVCPLVHPQCQQEVHCKLHYQVKCKECVSPTTWGQVEELLGKPTQSVGILRACCRPTTVSLCLLQAAHTQSTLCVALLGPHSMGPTRAPHITLAMGPTMGSDFLPQWPHTSLEGACLLSR